MDAYKDELLKTAKLFGGDDATNVIKTFLELGETTDDVIAKESGVSLNIVRKVLYKLYDYSLISCARERNDKTGWYIFRWKVQPSQLDAFIRIRKKRILGKLKNRLEFEKNHSFFVCEKCSDVRVTFEEAIESAFRCSKCGGQFVSANNAEIIEELSARIMQLEKELGN
jgi:transcription initiation factor TFIIE subunit alpha